MKLYLYLEISEIEKRLWLNWSLAHRETKAISTQVNWRDEAPYEWFRLKKLALSFCNRVLSLNLDIPIIYFYQI